MIVNGLRKMLESATGQYASLLALCVFTLVSITATGMGFLDLRLANADKLSPDLKDHLTTWPMTIGVILAMIAALNAMLGVGLTGEGRWKRVVAQGLGLVFYILFAFWSVGFGYGFFWKELAGQEFTRLKFKAAIEETSDMVDRAESALFDVETAVVGATAAARERADLEAASGGTCANHTDSRSGDGPLTRSRFAFADRAQALRQDVTDTWTSKLTRDRIVLDRRIAALTAREAPDTHLATSAEESRLLDDLSRAADLDMATRGQRYAVVFDDARAFVRQANALRDTQAPFFADRLDALAAQVGPDPANPGRPAPDRADDPTYCWDVVLHEKLSAAAQSLRNLKHMDQPAFEFTEGPRATRAAFFNLAKVATSPLTGSEGTFGSKEWLSLFASIAVDAGIFFMALLRALTASGAVARAPKEPDYLDLNPIKGLPRR